jgi:hypothetical protein
VRSVALVLAAGLLGGCARDPYVTSIGASKTGDWWIAHQVDRVTGAELPSASVIADASNTYEMFPKPSIFQITCIDGQPAVRFGFEFKVGSDRNFALGYRFDDKPGHESVKARVVVGQMAVVIEDKPAVAQFMNDLAGSHKLYMRFRSMNGGRTAAEYPVEGSAAAIQAASAGCPSSPSPAPQAGSQQQKTS